jgi:elongation of very long chain fatty acids protein 4
MEKIWNDFRAFALPLGDAIINWARPEGWVKGPTHAYFGAGFDFALAIALGYLAFVFFGTMVMSTQNAVRGLYPFKFLYNMVQVMLCSYMCIEALVRAASENYSLLPCNKFNHQNPPIAFILWVFYMSKILDFLDTVFIILEKRWQQLSFLHVYHHTSIFLVRNHNFIHPFLHFTCTRYINAFFLVPVLLAEHERWL